MLHSALGLKGCVAAPHRIAALAGRDVLAAGGSAIEAMVAAAATIAVVYPHMSGLGGDAFWLIERPGEPPVAISGAGRAAGLADVEWYRSRGHGAVPARGPDATLLVPGAVSSWQIALDLLGDHRLGLEDLLRPAIDYATQGTAVTQSQARMTAAKREQLEGVEGFAEIFLPGGATPATGERFAQPALGALLQYLADEGLDSFYRGDVAAAHGRFLQAAGSPLRQDDFEHYRAEQVAPLRLETSVGTVFNLPPPTQGIASLLILGAFDRLGVTAPETFAHIHGLVEATKQAYRLRNRHLGDPGTMTQSPASWLASSRLDQLATAVDAAKALPWPEPSVGGDTVWMGAADSSGMVVSFIQSIFWEFGSGLACPQTGVLFENRGAGFSLDRGPNQLAPGKQPFHTLNPALAHLKDGRIMAYGTMGGEGQPQTQSAVFTRYAFFGDGLQRAVTAPRWLLGRTWGDANSRLKLEGRFSPDLIAALSRAGHNLEVLGDFDDVMGHAGAVVRHPSGTFEAASDPRADGAAIAF